MFLWSIKFNFFLFAVFCFVFVVLCDDDVNDEAPDSPIKYAVKKALKLTARNCMKSVNATETDLEKLRQDPPFPDKTSCIVKCLLEKINIVKNNSFSRTGFLTVVSPLVMMNKPKLDHMIKLADSCDKEINNEIEEPCQLGNEVTQCIFKYAPELHFKS